MSTPEDCAARKPARTPTCLGALAFVILMSSVSGFACATIAARADLVRKRAGFDLDCSEVIRVVDLGNGNAFGASGCGRRASYIVHCTDFSNKSSCTAIMNSDEKSGPR